MRNSQNTTTILLAVFVALFLAVLDWFFLVSPKMSATSEARAATEAQLLANSDLEVLLAQREADFAKLPELREAVWSIRDQFPAVVDVASVRDQLTDLDARYGIYLQSDSIGAPVEVLPGTISLGAAYAAYGLEPYAEGLTFTSLSAVPITLTLQGSYDTVMAYVDDLQVGEHRYFLISSLTVSPVAADPSASPPTFPGDIQVTVAGSFFLLDYGLAGITTRPELEPFPGDEPLPSEVDFVPENDRNFFVPSS